MTDYMHELGVSAAAWSDSFDQGSAGVEIVNLSVQDPFGEEEPLTLPLRELVSDDLRFVLACDAAARVGSGPIARGRHGEQEPETGEVLRYAAARLDFLTSGGELAPRGVDCGWPRDTAEFLVEASTAADALSELVEYAVGRLLANLDEGGLVA